MKRHYLAVAVLALALGMTACSSGNKETTAAPTTTASQTETEKATEAEDDMELEYFYGFVGEVADKVVTVKDDEGKEVKFDVSEAKIEGADAIGEGDEVEVAYAGELSADTTKAKSVDIVTSAAAEAAEEAAAGGGENDFCQEAAAEEDDIVTGTVEKADDNTLTLTTDEGTYTFNTKIAQKVSKDGIKSGVQADVTYYGDLEDETDKPVATKIVTEDAMDSEDAKINTLSGKVAEVGADYVVIDTADPENTLFTFLGKEGMFDKLKVGDTATVIYEGTLTNKTITATGVK